jgi:hypothetical protein
VCSAGCGHTKIIPRMIFASVISESGLLETERWTYEFNQYGFPELPDEKSENILCKKICWDVSTRADKLGLLKIMRANIPASRKMIDDFHAWLTAKLKNKDDETILIENPILTIPLLELSQFIHDSKGNPRLVINPYEYFYLLPKAIQKKYIPVSTLIPTLKIFDMYIFVAQEFFKLDQTVTD